MPSNIFTTIEITDTHIKLMQAKKLHHKRVICACVIKTLLDFTDKELVEKLSEITTSLGAQLDNLTVVIPRRLAILKFMRLPSQNDAELRKMIALQLVDQIPYPIEDIVYDFVVLDKESSGFVRLLVIVVHREISDRFFKICKEARLQPERFILSSFGIVQWIGYQQGLTASPVKVQSVSSQPTLVIDIDVSHAEICFCYQHKLLFSRSVNYGARDLKEDRKSGFLDQINLSLKNYQKENIGPAIKNILVLSVLPEVNDLKEQLEKMLPVLIDFHSPLDNVLCQKNLDLATVKNQPGLSLTVPVGLVLTDSKGLVNFLPQEVRTIKRSRRRKFQWVQFVVSLVLTCLLALFVPGIEFLRKVAYLKELEIKSEKLRPELDKMKKKQEVIAALQEDLGSRVVITDLIQEIYRIASSELSFQTLSLDTKGRFVIHGYAQTSASVYSFQESLVKSRWFKEVNLEFATKRKIFNREVVDFQITSRIRAPHD